MQNDQYQKLLKDHDVLTATHVNRVLIETLFDLLEAKNILTKADLKSNIEQIAEELEASDNPVTQRTAGGLLRFIRDWR